MEETRSRPRAREPRGRRRPRSASARNRYSSVVAPKADRPPSWPARSARRRPGAHGDRDVVEQDRAHRGYVRRRSSFARSARSRSRRPAPDGSSRARARSGRSRCPPQAVLLRRRRQQHLEELAVAIAMITWRLATLLSELPRGAPRSSCENPRPGAPSSTSEVIPILATEYAAGGFTALRRGSPRRRRDTCRRRRREGWGFTSLVKTAHLAEGFHMNFEVHHAATRSTMWANLHVIMAIRNCEFLRGAAAGGGAEVRPGGGHRDRPERARARDEPSGAGRAIDFRADRAKEDRRPDVAAVRAVLSTTFAIAVPAPGRRRADSRRPARRRSAFGATTDEYRFLALALRGRRRPRGSRARGRERVPPSLPRPARPGDSPRDVHGAGISDDACAGARAAAMRSSATTTPIRSGRRRSCTPGRPRASSSSSPSRTVAPTGRRRPPARRLP